MSLSKTSPRVGTSLTATLTDGDGGVTSLTWKWSNSDGEISGATSSSYTAASGDAGKTLTAKAMYNDAHGTGKSVTSPPTSQVRPEVTTANACTVFDADGNGEIDLDEATAAIREYFTDLISQAAVTEVIKCYNTDNPPGQVGTPALTSADGSLTATWVKPSGPEPAHYEVQHKLSTASWPTGSGTNNGTSLMRTISGLTAGTYEVRVRACNAEVCGDWSGTASIIVTVTAPATPEPTPEPTATSTPPLPTVKIAAVNARVKEGENVLFTLTASSAPDANLDVTVNVTHTGSFLTATIPTTITIAGGDTTAQLILTTTENDGIDEVDGTVSAEIRPGDGYIVDQDSNSASVTIWDAPPAPTDLRANGHVKEFVVDGETTFDVVTLRWNPSRVRPGTTFSTPKRSVNLRVTLSFTLQCRQCLAMPNAVLATLRAGTRSRRRTSRLGNSR